MVFLPQSPRRFTQSSPRVFRCTSSLCSLCLLRVLCGSLFFYHKAHGGLHKVNRGFFEVLIFCALCVFFVYSVVPYFFHHKAHGGLHKVHQGFSVQLFFVFSVSSLRSLWLSSMGFHHKAYRVFIDLSHHLSLFLFRVLRVIH
jgi:cytochrome bd-type quinol oxidase subunit 2